MRRPRALVTAAAVSVILLATGLGVANAVSRRPAAPHATPQTPDTISSNNETTFSPITPCRIADTRTGGGAITHGATRVFQVTGTSGFPTQGGRSGGCGIPASATAVSLSLTATNETGSGWLTTYPNGAARPLTTAVSFTRGVTISGLADAAIGTAGRVAAFVGSSTAAIQLILDVNGYFAPPMAGLIRSDGTAYDGTTRLVSSSRLGTGSYEVTFDRSVVLCTPTANVYNVVGFARVDPFSSTNDNSMRVTVYNASGVATDAWVFVTVRC